MTASIITRRCARHPLLFAAGAMLAVAALVADALGVDLGFTLDDERLQQRFEEAVEFQGRQICYLDGQWRDCRQEVGPPGIRHTLGIDWPWNAPGGRVIGAKTRKFYWPSNLAVRYVNEQQRADPRRQTLDGYRKPSWRFPQGFTVFEAHQHQRGHYFEVRVIEAVKQSGTFDEKYEVHLFRPFQSPEDLPFTPSPVRTDKLQIHSNHSQRPFVFEGQVTYYEDADVDWVLLTSGRAWPDDLGHEWNSAGIGNGWLTPKHYGGWMIGNGNRCATCHDTAGSFVARHDHPAREWYGALSGADGIFSLFPPAVLRGRR